VNRLVQNVSRNSDAKVPFTIKVVDSDEVNAFALPGGFMFVNTGLIMRADNEAELAGVLAHEIAHVAARHGTRQATRGQLINYGTIPLIFMGGWAGYGVRQAITLAVPLGFLKFSRNMEAEADLLGLQYMYKSGYDPTEFVNFFERIQTLEKKKPGAVSKLFSSHPMTGDRIRADAENHPAGPEARAAIRGGYFRIPRCAHPPRHPGQPPQTARRPRPSRVAHAAVGQSGSDRASGPDRHDRRHRWRSPHAEAELTQNKPQRFVPPGGNTY
jgi:hypothetical protein